MATNIFQVLKESDLDEIIDDHPRNLILVMFSSKTCAPCMSIKPTFISLANKNPDCFFVYIDVPSFTCDTNKYSNKIEMTPTFVFYFNNQEVGNVTGAQEESLIATLNYLKMRIEEMKKQAQEYNIAQAQAQAQAQAKTIQTSMPPTTPTPTQTKTTQTSMPPATPAQATQTQTQNDTYISQNNVSIEQKLDILKRLYDLSQHGIQLCKNYGIDSDYREMVLEYNMHLDNIKNRYEAQQQEEFEKQQLYQSIKQQEEFVKQQDTVTPQTYQESELEKQQKELINQQLQQLKKQEHIKKINELNKLTYMMQTQQIYKLQQLKNMQQMKENSEKSKHNIHSNRNNRSNDDNSSDDSRHRRNNINNNKNNNKKQRAIN